MAVRLCPMPRCKAALAVRWQSEASFALWPNNPFTWPLTAAQTKAFWLRCRREGSHWLLACEGARPVGQLWARQRPDGSVHLGLILVAPHARGKGMGEAMMREAAARFAPATVTVDVYESNIPARRCYEMYGWYQYLAVIDYCRHRCTAFWHQKARLHRFRSWCVDQRL